MGTPKIAADGGVDLNNNLSRVDLCLLDPADEGNKLFYYDDDDTLTVLAHGTKTSVIDHRTGQMVEITAKDLAVLLRQNPDFANAKDVLLYACDTGGDRSFLGFKLDNFAQQLANELQMPVQAPNKRLAPTENMGVFGPSSNGKGINKNDSGKFVKFKP